MIRGVSFKITQTIESNVLWHILKNVNINNYNWYNIENQNETWANSKGDEFFTKTYFTGESFFNHISQNCHYVVFLKLQAYFGDHTFFDIHTYKDFQRSDCQILILIYDCEFVEIFIKDQKLSELIYESMVNNKYENVEYITDLNDNRTKLDVL